MIDKLVEKVQLIDVSKDKELLRLIYDFNFNPASYAHNSWIDNIIPCDLCKRIAMSKRGQKKLSKWILQHNNLNHDFHYGFEESKNRLALLPSDVLKTLTFYGGIALIYREIKNVIDQSGKKRIVNSIGEQGYRFAVARAPLLVGNMKSKYKINIQWDHLTTYIKKIGDILFVTVFDDAPEPVYKRVLLKFQNTIEPDRSLIDGNRDPAAIASFYLRILKQIGDRRWQQLIM